MCELWYGLTYAFFSNKEFKHEGQNYLAESSPIVQAPVAWIGTASAAQGMEGGAWEAGGWDVAAPELEGGAGAARGWETSSLPAATVKIDGCFQEMICGSTSPGFMKH